MSQIYQMPPILSGDTAKQVKDLRDYLVRLVRSLPDANNTQLVERAVQQAVATSKTQDAATTRAARSQAAALQDLIVKTANEVYATIDVLETNLSQTYLAKSDFGDYTETVDTKITQTAKETVESYNYGASIQAVANSVGALASQMTSLQGEIRRGVITDPDTGDEALGIAISQQLQVTGSIRTVDGVDYYELTPGQTLGIYTSTGWEFWINGAKKGWFTSEDSMLHVAQIVVESSLQIGESWVMTATGGFGIRYIGS